MYWMSPVNLLFLALCKFSSPHCKISEMILELGHFRNGSNKGGMQITLDDISRLWNCTVLVKVVI